MKRAPFILFNCALYIYPLKLILLFCLFSFSFFSSFFRIYDKSSDSKKINVSIMRIGEGVCFDDRRDDVGDPLANSCFLTRSCRVNRTSVHEKNNNLSI